MSLDFLPPQAYTKETLLKAYNWLQSQSDQVKELATTPDQLVSLYLKSSRSGQESLQRYTTAVLSQSQQPPASVQTPSASQANTSVHPSSGINSLAEMHDRPSLQSFKSELKNLAGMMGDLEKPGPQPVGPQAYVMPASHSQSSGQNLTNGSAQQSPGGQSHGSQPSDVQQNISHQPPASSSISHGQQLDELTRNLIQEVKSELNLSSDVEAIRMLVKIGYQKVKSLYK